MMTTTADRALNLPHVRRMLAAVNGGADGVLPYLADALDDEGDARAARLRRLRDALPDDVPPAATPTPARLGPYKESGGHHVWGWALYLGAPWEYMGYGQFVRPEVFSRLRDNILPGYPGVYRMYATRSAAFLALAAALAD